MFQEITALHQQVREYVEQQEPAYKVTSIDGYSTTGYMCTLANQDEYIHVRTDIRFRVSGIQAGARYKRISCDVHVTSDGQLFMGDRLVSI
jgi:ATP-dependent Zn protease